MMGVYGVLYLKYDNQGWEDDTWVNVWSRC